jgi:hypothetical protein
MFELFSGNAGVGLAALHAGDLELAVLADICQRSSNSLVGGCAVQVFPWSVVQVIP